jgi:hypothetical protein
MIDAKKPIREPDVILPEYMGWAEVHVWISECVFKIHGHYFNCISSTTLGLFECRDPVIYLKKIAESGSQSNPRKKTASDFLETLDSILLSIE